MKSALPNRPGFGPPEIMDTDQGSQFRSVARTDRLKRFGMRGRMDGRARYLGNIFLELLWRLLKHECVRPRAWETGAEAKIGQGTGSDSLPAGRRARRVAGQWN